MGRSSTSSTKGKGKASKKTTSVKANKVVYCSKVIASILDKLIENELDKVKKHPKTVGKWMAKMRSSILKKISTATPILFKTEKHDMKALDDMLSTNLKKIDATKAQVLYTIHSYNSFIMSDIVSETEFIDCRVFKENVAR